MSGSKPRICMLVNSLAAGGAENVVVTLYRQFLNLGYQVSLLCLERNVFFEPEQGEVQYLSGQTGERENPLTKLISLFRFARRLKRYLRRNKIVLVQSHLYRANYVNVMARLMGSDHAAQLVNHGMPSAYTGKGWSGWLNFKLIKTLYPRGDQVICPSSGMIEELIRLGVQRQRTAMIPNPIDLAGIEYMSRGEPDRLPQNQSQLWPARYLLFLGRLEPVKRIPDILKAFKKIAAEFTDVDLVLIGDGSEQQAIVRQAAELGLQQRVYLAGELKNPYPHLRAAELLVLASEYEGFSNVIVEALSLGVPVISTDCQSGPGEILGPDQSAIHSLQNGELKQAEYGLLVPVAAIDALAEGMRQLLLDQKLKAEFKRMGPGRAADYSPDLIGNRYAGQIDTLVQAG